MVLGFKTEMFGRPNYFIDKIWDGFFSQNVLPDPDKARNEYIDQYHAKFGRYWDVLASVPELAAPKIHTLRLDIHNRWKPGMKLQMCVGVRTKNYFQFAPTLVCKSIQQVWLTRQPNDPTMVMIDGKVLTSYEKEVFARRDGFSNAMRFDDFFNPQMEGRKLFLKLIHWTDFKY